MKRKAMISFKPPRQVEIREKRRKTKSRRRRKMRRARSSNSQRVMSLLEP
jgi:hypothetical protein